MAVTAVANGIQALNVLEDLITDVDLVLTEVVIPCLSGIGLLCKIMRKKTCKDIPVISEYISYTLLYIVKKLVLSCPNFFFSFTFNCYTWWVLCTVMSSHDSRSMVFKCLSKGAVDFLVKPIRKNELKNLWQHVWRKCHTVSFSYSILLYHGPIHSEVQACNHYAFNCH